MNEGTHFADKPEKGVENLSASSPLLGTLNKVILSIIIGIIVIIAGFNYSGEDEKSVRTSTPKTPQPTTIVKEITLTTNWSEPTEFIQDNWSYGSRVIRGNFKMLYVCDADEPGMEPIPIKYGEVFEPKMRMHRIKWRVDADQPVIMKYWVTKDSP